MLTFAMVIKIHNMQSYMKGLSLFEKGDSALVKVRRESTVIDKIVVKFFFDFTSVFIILMVGKKRLELLSLAALVPKTSAYTNSATCPY